MAKVLKTDALRRTPLSLWERKLEVTMDEEGERTETVVEKEFTAYSYRLTPANRDVLRPVFDEFLERRQKLRDQYPLVSTFQMLKGEARSAYQIEHGWTLDDQARIWKEEDDALDILETLAYAQAIIEAEHVLTPERAQLIGSDIEGEFWQNQDVPALKKAVNSFRDYFSS